MVDARVMAVLGQSLVLEVSYGLSGRYDLLTQLQRRFSAAIFAPASCFWALGIESNKNLRCGPVDPVRDAIRIHQVHVWI